MIWKDSLTCPFNHKSLAKSVVKPKPYIGDSNRREVGTKALLFMEACESKLASGFADSIRSKNNRLKFMIAQLIICTCISQLLLQLCCCVWEVSRSYDSLWRLTEISIELYSLLWFIIVRGCGALLGSKKTIEEKSSGNYVQASKSPLPGVTQDALNYPSNKLWQHMWKAANQGSSERLNTQRFYW